MRSIKQILDSITRTEDILEGLNNELNEKRSNQLIQCECCKKKFRIRNIVVIQTHWYTPPYGCSGGDYLNQGELQFLCPRTNARNRILFERNLNIPYGDRNKFDNNPDAQFKHLYKYLFKEVISTSMEYEEEKISPKCFNNYYIDKNRKKFSLAENV